MRCPKIANIHREDPAGADAEQLSIGTGLLVKVARCNTCNILIRTARESPVLY